MSSHKTAHCLLLSELHFSVSAGDGHVERAHLLHVVQVLHAGGLAQVDAMGNVLTQHEGADQVISVTSFTCNHTHHNNINKPQVCQPMQVTY